MNEGNRSVCQASAELLSKEYPHPHGGSHLLFHKSLIQLDRCTSSISSWSMSSSSSNLIWSWKKSRTTNPTSQPHQKSKFISKAKKSTTKLSCFTLPLHLRIHFQTSLPKAGQFSYRRRNPFWLLQNLLTNRVRNKPYVPLNSTIKPMTSKRPTAVLTKVNLLSKLLKKTLKSTHDCPYPNSLWPVKE